MFPVFFAPSLPAIEVANGHSNFQPDETEGQNMARNLKTGWVVLATSGPVVHGDEDGRFIKKEWLQDMAETYNTKVFTAKIWPEHRRYSSAGTVLALKVEPATDPELKGELQLFGILSPADWLITANQAGDYTFPSIEVGENFRGTGKFFLKGLGVTDDPASAGVTELKFSSKAGDEVAHVFNGHQFNLAESLEQEKSLLHRIFGREDSSQPEQESEAMDEKQFSQLMDTIKDQGKKLDALEDKFKSLNAGANSEGAEGAEGGEGEGGEGEEGTVSAKEFNALKSQLDDLNKKFTAALNEENPGTNVPEGKGGAEEEVI